MPHSTDRYRAITVLTSTLYRTDGTLQTTLQAEPPPKLYRWSTIDAMEPCDGFKGRPTCWDAKTVQAGGSVPNPPHCPLWANGCEGRAQTATGHKKREDLITALQLTDDYRWRTQYLSQDAARRGLMYEHFEAMESDDGATNVTAAAEYDPDLEVYWGADEGYESPMVVVLGQMRADGTITIFDEVYLRHKEHDEFLNTVHQPNGLDGDSEESWYVAVPGHKPRGPYKRPRRVYPDPTAKEFERKFARRLRSPARVRTDQHKVMDGVAIVRRFVRNWNGERKLLIHPRCRNLISEMQRWRAEQVSPGVWIDEPEPNEGDTNPDHANDSLRYMVQNLTIRFRPGFATG